MKKIFAFDVDGTLTMPRQRITPEFEKFFADFVNSNTVYLVTGSDYPKISEQLPTGIITFCEGVFTCSGAELWKGNDRIYQKSHTFPKRLVEASEHFIDTSPYPLRCGTHIEPRPGMLNISVVGRDATLAQRKAYHAWEQVAQERLTFVSSLLKEFPEYEASTGGEISIDIVPKGWTNAVVRTEIEKQYPGCSITFYGDKMGPNGNDKPLADELARFPQHSAISVETFLDTWKSLLSLQEVLAA